SPPAGQATSSATASSSPSPSPPAPPPSRSRPSPAPVSLLVAGVAPPLRAPPTPSPQAPRPLTRMRTPRITTSTESCSSTPLSAILATADPRAPVRLPDHKGGVRTARTTPYPCVPAFHPFTRLGPYAGVAIASSV